MSKNGPKNQKWLPIAFGIVLAILILIGIATWMKSLSSNPAPETPQPAENPMTAISGSPSPAASTAAAATPATPTTTASAHAVDLSVDSNGMSKSTVELTTNEGVIKFKFYPQDAPNTVNRMVELIQKGFYNGLTFHRVVPGFVVQGGDPTGTGSGGSGQKLKAEFNNRHHVEGTLAMARAADPDSADSQFYICLSNQPQLDHNYTVFGQVIEGMDVVRKIKVGDKITSMVIE